MQQQINLALVPLLIILLLSRVLAENQESVFRARIEHRENGILKQSLIVDTHQAIQKHRAFLQVQQQGSEDSFSLHYQEKPKVWLKLRSSGCQSVDERQVEKELFGEPLVEAFVREKDERIGLAQLLSLANRLAKEESNQQRRLVEERNIKAFMVSRRLESQLKLEYSDARLEAYFEQFSTSSQPLKLLFAYEKLATHTKFLTQISWFSVSTDEPAPSSFHFPLGVGCGRALAEASINSKWLLEENNRLVSFRAQLVELEPDKRLAVEHKSAVRQFHIAFDPRGGLLRRDELERDDADLRLSASTIFHFSQNKKYHARFNLGAQSASSTSCFVDKISPTQKQAAAHNEFFRQFGGLQFMGSAKLDEAEFYGRELLVFEQSSASQAPFWLLPSMIAKVKNANGDQLEERDEFSRVGGSVSVDSLLLVYYFEAPTDAQASTVGALRRVEIFLREPERGLVRRALRVRVSQFNWSLGALQNTAANPFSVTEMCNSGALSSAQLGELRLQLEPTSEEQIEARLVEQLENESERNELLIGAFDEAFKLSRSRIISIRSELSRTQLAPSAIINIVLQLSDKPGSLRQLECEQVGRGRFLVESKLKRNSAFTLEQCLWFAAKEAARGVLFALDLKRAECLVSLKEDSPSDAHFSQAREHFNFFPYEFGELLAFKLFAREPNAQSADEDEMSWLKSVLRWKADSRLIGEFLTLRPANAHELTYRIKSTHISGVFFNDSPGQLKIDERLHGAGYEDSEVIDSGGIRITKKVRANSVASMNPQVGGIMSQDLCKTMCLLDAECSSYSFCEQKLGLSSGAECVLSRIDLEQVEVKHLLASEARDARVQRRSRASVLLSQEPTGVKSASLNLRVAKNCFIASKSYAGLFEQTHLIKVDFARESGAGRVVSVAGGPEQCAKLCYRQNLDYLRSLIAHRCELNSVRRELEAESGSKFALESEESMKRLQRLLDWHQQHARTLCFAFMFAEEGSKETNNSCLLQSGSKNLNDKEAVAVELGQPGAQSTARWTQVRLHKLIYLNLYEQMSGFRLTATRPRRLKHSHEGYIELLRDQLSGLNEQVVLNADDTEHCARICTLQILGPKPSCASFDFVVEHPKPGVRANKFCLLNSQSLVDLSRRNELHKRVDYADGEEGSHFWHFEPRDSLILPADQSQLGDEELLMFLNSNESSLLQSNSKNQWPNISASLTLVIITLAALGSGFVLSFYLSRSLSKRGASTMDSYFRSDVFRLVHRLSGVSLGRQFGENEVRM